MTDPISMVTAGASGLKALAPMFGIGSSIASGAIGAQAAQVKARGEELNIEGQMLANTGRAFAFDVESQEFKEKSEIESYQADISRMNQQIAESNANYERNKGEVEAEHSGMESRYELGVAKAAQGASGIDVNSGSSQRVRESMIEIGQYNEAMIRSNAAKIAYGYEVQATQAHAEAAIHDMTSSLDKAQAANATTAAGITRAALPLEQQAMGLAAETGKLGAEASLISAAGSVASKWMQGSFLGMSGMGGSVSA